MVWNIILNLDLLPTHIIKLFKSLIPNQFKIRLKENFTPKKKVRWGGLRKIHPFNRDFGVWEGTAVDRYYIEIFLHNESASIKGDVLEIAENRYTKKYASGNYQSHVLQLDEAVSQNDIVGDLVTGKGLSDEQFDCIILTQTLPFIYDFRSALGNLRRILKPNGVLLATLSGISQISRFDMDRWGDYWRFTGLSSRKVFSEFFPIENIVIKEYGNALTATAFIQGIVAEELEKKELDYYDQDYPVSICLKVLKD